ncbi:myotubularin-related protein 6-like isoform X2 [Varroa jacobsoni]|uniref:myotubularin-related protein 6-like isoform X2 n=1 Tax=Varroa jacobsoni TaxID=62625 RepID=UPI000BF61BAC|nr:myotubularin-related protein 6-like isoform X2 [Varroa jacobsoni]
MDMIKISKIENVRMLDRFNEKKHSVGSLFLTTTHLIFNDPERRRETWLLHMHIQSMEKQALTTSGCPLVVRSKNFLSVTFLIPAERQCHDIYQSLLQLSQSVHVHQLYCFHYTACSEDLPKTFGWDFFSLEEEFQRQGVPNKQWIKSDINSNYQICNTYSALLWVPAGASEQQLIECSRFRSKGRLPVLTYYHKVNGAAISRCSQPLSGFSGKRSPEDEQVFDCILKANTNPNSHFLYIVDTRPKVNAFAQRMAGKGFESAVFYEKAKFQFFGIENIHVMRASLQKLLEAAEMRTPNHGAFLAMLESSGWLKHIRAVLETAYFVARQIDYGISVVVHCSDGWDRTAQTCALASLLLDPFYRTFKGFQVLIEKDWLSFGHKFMDRCGFIQGDPKEVAPIFTQFVEGAWQLTQQFPSSFEFNERFLITLHDHVYSAQFGTYIGNCERDRRDLNVAQTTYSLWGYLANNADAYRNPLYQPELDGGGLLEPCLNPQAIRYWRGMYNRFELGVHPREQTGDLLAALKDHSTSMRDHADYLRQQIDALKLELGNSRLGSYDLTLEKSTENAQSVKATQEETSYKAAAGNDGKEIDNKNQEEIISYANLSHPLAVLDEHSNTAYCNNVNNLNDCDSSSGWRSSSGVMVGSNTEPRVPAIETAERQQRHCQQEQQEQHQQRIGSIALEWASLRKSVNCSCTLPVDSALRKFHCWSCGGVFCGRCLDRQLALPGHLSGRSVTVCRCCFKSLTKSNSMEYDNNT